MINDTIKQLDEFFYEEIVKPDDDHYVGLGGGFGVAIVDHWPSISAEIKRLQEEKASGKFHPWKAALEGTIEKQEQEIKRLQGENEKMEQIISQYEFVKDEKFKL